MRLNELSILAAGLLLFTMTSCKHSDAVVDASGTFESTEIIVSPETTGKILQLNLNEGDDVHAGVQLGLIDTTQLNLKKIQLQASILAAQNRRPDIPSQMAGLRQQLETANKEKIRFENLVKADAANQKQLDDIHAQIKLLQKQLNAQQTALRRTDKSISDESAALQSQLDQIKDQLQKSYITSPVDGTILVKYAEAGELASPLKPLFKVANLNQMYLKAYLTTDQLSTVKMGQTVDVIAEFGPKNIRTYTGKVSWISSKSEFTPKTVRTRDERASQVFAVKVLVQNDGFLKIGMYGGLRFSKQK
ncbi:MAG: efflux RND transporter periplasmic adaptor subunit [Bacteroidota bacterium]|nr:efflux RND transporter periplasmic adaptor subunit [Bacteroidota bacterium]